MKYIVDIPDNAGWIEYYSPVNEENTRFKGTAIGIDRLEPYTEPDRKAIEDAQEEAWEFAKQVTIMTPDDKCELWGTSKYNTINLGYSYAEAKARYEEWKKQKEGQEKEKVMALADDIGIHKLYALVCDIRGE